MIDNAIMLGILAFLLFLLVFRAKYSSDGNESFFDLPNSKAMRGFWCLIVILVHIPQAYQNTIQDMIGSFAYIGVTFFFLTSAYGLSSGVSRKPQSIRRFWLARLPKLIVPNWMINIVFALLFFLICDEKRGLSELFYINDWVRWLLACYLAFWLAHYFKCCKKYCKIIVCILVFALSLTVYCLRNAGFVQLTTWCPEVIGFVWGIVLFDKYDAIKAFFARKWVLKTVLACLLAMLLGASYLKLKHVVFWGDYALKIALGLSILGFILLLNGKIKIGNKISCFLGDISFEVYLIHGAVFRLLEEICPNLGSGVFILASIVTTVFFATIIHSICAPLLRKLK